MFQSTFPQGERRLENILLIAVFKGFNPRSRKGNDLGGVHDGGEKNGFQSTFPQGERRNKPAGESPGDWFQSTFPQGERPGRRSPRAGKPYSFNPRSRKGNDHMLLSEML